MTQIHSIKKVNFNLNFATQAAAEKARRKYLNTFQREVLPKLAKVFDEYATGDEIIRINRLTIDLGIIAPSADAKLLNQSIIVAIEKQLKGIIAQKDYTKDNNVRTIGLVSSKMELIVHFLKYGYLPTTAVPFSFQEVIKSALAEQPTQLLKIFQSTYQKNGNYILRRLVYQCTESFLLSNG